MLELATWITGLGPFLVVAGISVYYLTLTAKKQARHFEKKSGLARFILDWLPTIPLVLGTFIVGPSFHFLLPSVEILSFVGIASGAGYGLVAAALSSKIYEQALRKVASHLPGSTGDKPDVEPGA